MEDEYLSQEALAIEKRIKDLDIVIERVKPFYLALREERAKLEMAKVHNQIKESTLSTLGMGY